MRVIDQATAAINLRPAGVDEATPAIQTLSPARKVEMVPGAPAHGQTPTLLGTHPTGMAPIYDGALAPSHTLENHIKKRARK